jgi:predicted ester cyclase
VRSTWRGTNTADIVAPAMRIPATSKRVTVTNIAMFRFAGGKVAEAWIEMDNLGLYQQLGLIPIPEPVS